jgi:peptide/nickel transport system substrate-binding protein
LFNTWTSRVAQVALTTAIGLTACSADLSPPAAASRLGTDVDAGTLDPRLMRNTTAYRVNNLIYDGLVRLDADLSPVPGLAHSWENSDPTTWIFHLRDGVRFHDGTLLTAEDVVFTYRTILDPGLRSPFRPLLLPIRHVEAVDGRTVRLELSEPYAPLLSYLDAGIVSQAYVEGGGDPATEPMGTGPMRLLSWQRGSRITLEAFAEHWAGAPAVQRFEFVVVADNTARAQAFEAGDLDIIQSPLSPQDVRRLEADDRFHHTIVPGLAITYLNVNTRAPTLSDPALRLALGMLVDRETIVNEIYEGVDRVASSILLPSSWAYSPEIRQPHFDPDSARQMLAELGWADTDGDAVLDRDGQPLTIELSTHSEDPNRIQAAEFMQTGFRQHGIDARVAISDWPAFFASVQAGRHEIALLGWTQIVDPDRLMYGQFTTGGALNYGGYSNVAVDSLLTLGRSSMDEEARRGAYQAAAEILANELPFLVISYQDYQVFHRPEITLEADVRGMMRSAIGL